MTQRVIDWSEVFEDFRRAGLRDAAIVRALGVSPTAVRNYRNGIDEPSFRRGEAILALWCRVTSKTLDAAPRTNYVASAATVTRSRTTRACVADGFAALDAVFRPGIAQVIEKVSHSSDRREPEGPVSLTLPGFEI
ncbi:hypothetical protein [Paraburkholderia bannensis]|uniref:hypothetical protein n=1 Tax=Paraburkholderia bannensis TaxID=765414 RepID=UPI002AB6F30A|nr:hypothetical protein [Paraburkholderia bannensis]